MKSSRKLLAICLLAAICFGFAAQAQGEIVIDVVNGYLKTGPYRILLATDAEKPIAIGLSGTDVVLHVATGIGNAELNLGPGKVSVTERAVPYVRVGAAASAPPSAAPSAAPASTKATTPPAPAATPTPAPTATPKPSAGSGAQSKPGGLGETSAPLSGGEENCPQCGKPLETGDHSKLRCGHYVCVVGKRHFRICDTCNHYLCNNVNHDKCPACGGGYCRHTCGYVPQ